MTQIATALRAWLARCAQLERANAGLMLRVALAQPATVRIEARAGNASVVVDVPIEQIGAAHADIVIIAIERAAKRVSG